MPAVKRARPKRGWIVVLSAGCLGLLATTLGSTANATPARPHSKTLLIALVFNNNYASVIDPSDMHEVKQIPANSEGPATVYSAPDSSKLYLQNASVRGNTVSVIDTKTLTIDTQVPLGGPVGDRGTALPANGRHYYGVTLPDFNISQVDTATNRLLRTYAGVGPAFTVSKDDRTIFRFRPQVPFQKSSQTFTAYDMASDHVVSTMTFDGDSFWIQMNKEGTEVISTGNPTTFIDIRDPKNPKVVGSVPTGSFPLISALSPDGRQLWVPNAGDGTISVIDTHAHRLIRTIDTGGHYMTAVGFGSDPSRAYVAMTQDELLPTNLATAAATYLEVMAVATFLASHQGEFNSRPVLDRPGQVVAFDTKTFARAREKPTLLPSVPVFLEHFTVPSR
jgi:YVTN family beta-propeller protein